MVYGGRKKESAEESRKVRKKSVSTPLTIYIYIFHQLTFCGSFEFEVSHSIFYRVYELMAISHPTCPSIGQTPLEESQNRLKEVPASQVFFTQLFPVFYPFIGANRSMAGLI